MNASAAQAVLEEGAVRMGLDYVTSLGSDGAEAVVAARDEGGPFRGVADLARRVRIERQRLEALVRSGACDCLGDGVETCSGSSGSSTGRRPWPGAGVSSVS